MQSLDFAGSEIFDTQAVMMHNVKLVETAWVIGEWRKANTVEAVNTNAMNNRIRSRNIFGLIGSAIGEQALAILKTKEDKRVEVSVAAGAEKE